ncbi:MAG: amidohydrolase [Candidatus Zixiibacteriota bacterium]
MIISVDEIKRLAEEIFPYQLDIRRHLHQYPELSNMEIKTTQFISRQLKKSGIATKPLKMKTGAIGLINPRGNNAVAIRSDIDALPITEAVQSPFKSRNTGIMHACGHDIHMATVLGIAAVLNRLKDKIPGCVKFIFQPAEESPPGGAEMMIKEGVLNKPDVKMIFSLHTDPTLPVGKISLRDGATMASVTDFDITVIGVGGHGAVPHRAVDAIAVAAEIVESVQKIISRELNPMDPVVITFGTINGGTARNIIADRVVLNGTARALDADSRKNIPRLVKRTLDGICRARGARYELSILTGYPVLENDPSANIILEKSYASLFGKKNIGITPQTMGGEDYSFYLQKVPGAMFRLGVRNDKIHANKPWHSPEFIADERSMFFGTALLIHAVLSYFDS